MEVFTEATTSVREGLQAWIAESCRGLHRGAIVGRVGAWIAHHHGCIGMETRCQEIRLARAALACADIWEFRLGMASEVSDGKICLGAGLALQVGSVAACMPLVQWQGGLHA